MDPIVKPVRPRKEVIAEFKKWLEINSKPRKYPQPPKIDRGPKAPMSAEAINRLAVPRYKYVKPKKIPYVKQEALDYVASAKINELAVPKYKHVKPEDDPTCWAYISNHLVKPSALNYVATEKINEMARPVKPRKKWKRRRPRYVKKSALKAKITKRVLNLSKPVIKKALECNEFIMGKVSPKALKYKATKKIIKMSKPIRVTSKYVNPQDKWNKKFNNKSEDRKTEKSARK